MANRDNEWAKNEFGDAVLGDKRLTEQLVKIADIALLTIVGILHKKAESTA